MSFCYHVQIEILNMQIRLEDTFCSLASLTGKPSVVLCDRGTMDGSAYMRKELWAAMLQRYGADTASLRDSRYNAVVHLVTAAAGAERYFVNNEGRLETPEQAREIDGKTQDAWIGHPRLTVVDNQGVGGFEGKLQRLVDCVASLVGLPTRGKGSRKFLLKCFPAVDLPVVNEIFVCEKVYLTGAAAAAPSGRGGGDSGAYLFVRKRMSSHGTTYGQTVVTAAADDGQNHIIELKRVITGREYGEAVATRADPHRAVVRQRRLCFLWNAVYVEVNCYLEGPHEGLCLMQAQAGADWTPPPFVDVVEEVTGQKGYSAYVLSSVSDPYTSPVGTPRSPRKE
jgi:hypothetical protein